MPPSCLPAAVQLWEDGKAAEECGCAIGDNDCSNPLKEAWAVASWVGTTTHTDCGDDCSDIPAGDTCGATIEYETDLFGGDLRDVPVEHWAECCDKCAEDAECQAW